jgi:hypothetical protein
MLSEASINTKNTRILFWHLNQYFGHSSFVLEQRRRTYFSDCDFPPTVDKEVLPDKTVIPFWYREPHHLLKNQATKMLQTDDLGNLNSVDFAVGGDSGGSYFNMMLKVLFCLNDNIYVSRIFQMVSMSFTKDDIEIF